MEEETFKIKYKTHKIQAYIHTYTSVQLAGTAANTMAHSVFNMVATDETPSTQNQPDTGGTFGKLKQTLSSSLLTAQDR
ncbi:unnamed protein product, partial [Ceratitis capitata]